MSTNAGPYDTSRMYRSASHVLRDEEPARPALDMPAAADSVPAAGTGADAPTAAATSLRPTSDGEAAGGGSPAIA